MKPVFCRDLSPTAPRDTRFRRSDFMNDDIKFKILTWHIRFTGMTLQNWLEMNNEEYSKLVNSKDFINYRDKLNKK